MRVRDEQDFLDRETMSDVLGQAGFAPVRAEVTMVNEKHDLREFLDQASNRDYCSNLGTLPPEEHTAGLERIQADLNAGMGAADSEVALLAVVADRPPRGG
ncbi:MAG: hypothetical protein CL878_02250 [Dehalococcoidia bacterium]|nr:hypothetical protein [Dehalococcoidia bacterium]